MYLLLMLNVNIGKTIELHVSVHKMNLKQGHFIHSDMQKSNSYQLDNCVHGVENNQSSTSMPVLQNSKHGTNENNLHT